jgi:glycosyltransferase involved in cell wall biosynthesis
MDINQIIFYFLFISLMAGIFFTWVYFLLSMIKSIKESPRLERIKNIKNTFPRVSIILPARNEERYIRRCIDSLIKQDYPDFEIVLVNDESSDKTLEIMNEYQNSYPDIKVLSVNRPNYDWIGKNWACYQGYLKSNGNLLLFTDADSYHSENTMSLAVQNINHYDLDAITIMPRLLSYDFFTKVTLPLLTTFMHTKFSPLKVNNEKSKLGYFFGSYFIIKRDTYEKVGTHESVKHEIIEDGALGKKVKEGNFKLRMVRGERYVQAIWARNSSDLSKAMDRLLIPMFKENRLKSTLLSIALFFLMIFPFMMIPLSLTLSILHPNQLNFVILLVAIMILFILMLTNLIQISYTLFINKLYSLGFIIGALIIVSRFLVRIVISNKKSVVNWRDRIYNLTSNQSPQL